MKRKVVTALLTLLLTGCATQAHIERTRAALLTHCAVLPITQRGACDRAQLNADLPGWRHMRGGDLVEALVTAYYHVGTEVAAGRITAAQGEAQMARVQAALLQIGNQRANRQQAIARAMMNAGITLIPADKKPR